MSSRKLPNQSNPMKKPRFTQSLHNAIRNGETEFLKKLLQYDFIQDIEATDEMGLKPLHVALLCKNDEIAKLLIENGANVNAKSKEKQLLPEIRKTFEEIKYFYFKLTDIKKYYTKLTPLHIATINGSLKMVKMLVENGASVNIKNICGLRPIHSAILSGSVEIVKELFQNGATIGKLKRSKELIGAEDLVNCATENGSLEIIKMLFQNDIKVEGRRAVHIAIDFGKKEILKFLVKNGAVTYSDGETYPPLHRLDHDLEMVKFLLDNGADVEVFGGEDFEQTLLHRATRYGDLKLVKLLIQIGANIDCKSGPPHGDDEPPGDSTPLHFAISKGRLEIAELLIKAGASVNIPNAKAKTALHCAVEHENGKMIQALIHNGANVEAWFDCEECEDTYRTCAPKPLEITLEEKKINIMKTFLYVNLHK